MSLCQSPVTNSSQRQIDDVKTLKSRVNERLGANARHVISGVYHDETQGGAAVEGALVDIGHIGTNLHLAQVHVTQESELADATAIHVCSLQVLTTREDSFAHHGYCGGHNHTRQGRARESVIINENHRLGNSDTCQLKAAGESSIADALQVIGQHNRGQLLSKESRPRNLVSLVTGERAIQGNTLVIGDDGRLAQIQRGQFVKLLSNEQEVTGIESSRNRQ